MLLSVERLLELASKVEPRTLVEHMASVENMKENGVLLPELARLNQELAQEVNRHEAAMLEFEHHESTKDEIKPESQPSSKSPRSRRKASSPDFRLLLDIERNNEPEMDVLTIRSSPPHVNYQSMFLAAAIQLLDEKSIQSSQLNESIPRIPLPSDTILAGYLKKAKDNSLRSCSKKYVVLTRGILNYYSSDQIEKATKSQQIVLLRYVCREVLSQRFQSKFAFELIATDSAAPSQKTKSKLVWMARSEQERRMWVHAIRAVINEPVVYNTIIRGSGLDGDCYECLLLRRNVHASTDKSSYMKALQQSKKELRMPVDWIHKQEHSRQPCPRCGMDQVFKDLERDKVKINNLVYSGAEGSECVLGALTRVFMQIQAQNDKEKDLSEAQALCIVRSLLLSCNRTQSGGDTYEAVDFLYHNPDLNVLCPNQLEADPLEINVFLHDACPAVSQYVPEVDMTDHWVSRESSASNSSSSSRSGHVRHQSGSSICLPPMQMEELNDISTTKPSLHLFGKEQRTSEDPPLLYFAGKKMHISIVASTSYKVCDLNPQGHLDDDTWAVIDAVFEQSFVYVPQYGVLEGKGTVRVKHKK